MTSSSAMAFDTTGCVIERCLAAFAMLPHCATAARTLRCRNLRRRLICSTRFILRPIQEGYRDREKKNYRSIAEQSKVAIAILKAMDRDCRRTSMVANRAFRHVSLAG